VRDAAGIPVPEYPVQLCRTVAFPGHGRIVAEYAESAAALTDSAGHFVLAIRKTLYFNTQCRLQTPSPDSLNVDCPGFDTLVHKELALSAPPLQPKYPDDRDIVYGYRDAKGLELTGNLVTKTGAPVVDASILLAYLNSDGARVYDSTRSDKGGAFVLYTHSMDPGYVFTFLEYRKAGFVPYPVLGSWSSYASSLLRNGENIATIELGTAAMLRDTEKIGPPQGLNRSSGLRMRRETGAGGSELWTFDVPYDQCLVRVASPDGRLMFQGRLDKGIRAVRLSPLHTARMVLAQWSAPQGGGSLKVPGF